jgi:hypothetical protein
LEEARVAEAHFTATTTLDTTRQLRVSMPFSTLKERLSETHSLALVRLHQMEKMFTKYPDLRVRYNQFFRNSRHLAIML